MSVIFRLTCATCGERLRYVNGRYLHILTPGNVSLMVAHRVRPVSAAVPTSGARS